VWFPGGSRRHLGELVEFDGASHRHPLPQAREPDLNQLLRGERAVEVPAEIDPAFQAMTKIEGRARDFEETSGNKQKKWD